MMTCILKPITIPAIYIASIVTANYSVMLFGPRISPVNSFLFIGLDLSLRDKWHEQKGFALSVGLVFIAGVFSYLLNPSITQIAVASTVAFLAAGLVDALVYQLLRNRTPVVKINMSNIAGAAVDSTIFPLMAFGGFPIEIMLAQFVVKVFGGAVWAVILQKVKA